MAHTVVHNYKYSFYSQWTGSVNSVVQYLSSVGCVHCLITFIVFFFLFLSLACFLYSFFCFYGPVVSEINYTVFRKKNTHSHFLPYLYESCVPVDLNKNCSEYT